MRDESLIAPNDRRRAVRSRRMVIGAVLLLAAAGIAVMVWFRDRGNDRDSVAVTPVSGLEAALSAAKRHAEEGDDQSALAVMDRAVDEHPDSAAAWLLHAEVLFRLHRADEMIPSLRRALELDPDSFEAHANLAYALRYVGELEEARREAEWCLARDPEHVHVRRVLAEIHRDAGDVEGALREVRRALQSAPDDLQSRLLEADLLMFDRDFEAAYARLAPLEDAYREHQRFHATLVRAARLSGEEEEAARLERAFGKAR